MTHAKYSLLFRVIVILFLFVFAFCDSCYVSAANWPSWRGGIDGSGIVSERNLPLEWSITNNIRWKVKLPDRGNSTPIVWGERVFVAQAIEAENRRTLMCFHRTDGRLLWQKGVIYAQPEQTIKANSYCSASPVTDGERVIVSFGSAGLVCYDMEGQQLWYSDLGKLDHVWGNASSPVLYGDLCIHYHGPAKGAFLTALNKKTGETVWKYDEPTWNDEGRTDGFTGRTNGVIGTWSTPIIIHAGGRDELIMTFPMEVKAFDPSTGRELWWCGGLNPLHYDSAISSEGIVLAMGGYNGNSLAVKAGGYSDVTATRRLWHQVRARGGIGTGVIKDGYVYFGSGQVYCMELMTGKYIWEEKIKGAKGGSWSSMILSGDYIYLPLQSGDIAVFKASPKFEQVAVNSLKESSNSSIAVSDGELFFRTQQTLWCISTVKP
jgi:outer membrane protein assembly factor BamB